MTTTDSQAGVAALQSLSNPPRPGTVIDQEVRLSWRDPDTGDQGWLELPSGLLPADVSIVTRTENGIVMEGVESNGRWLGQDELCQILDQTKEQLNQQLAELGDEPPPHLLHETRYDAGGHHADERYLIDGAATDDVEAVADAFARIQDWEAERGRLFRINLRAALRGR